MKKIVYHIVLVVSISLGISCSDDFINVKNKQLLTEDSFWQTKEHAMQALTATYAALHSHSGSIWTFFEEIYIALAYRGDDIINNTGESYGKSLATFTNTSEESGPYNVWRASYAGIGRANQLLKRIPTMKALSQDDKNVILAEAKFLRAFYYFWLVTGFENVPLITTFEVDRKKLTPKQATNDQIWTHIEKDLTEAIPLMKAQFTGEWKGRATKGSATALLGKCYLFQEKWKKAEVEFAKVTTMGYELLPNYADNFNGKGENGKESLFEIQFSANRSNGQDERQVFNYEVSPSKLGGWELFYPSSWLVEQMKTDLDDKGNISERVYESIFFDDPKSEMWDRKQKKMVTYASVKADIKHPKYFKKYTATEDVKTSYIGTNISLIRYADVLLMYAEALNENGKKTEAITQVNKVRTRGGAKSLPTTMTQEVLRAQIRHHERPVELAMEYGIRWFDLYRWQRGKTATESIRTTLISHKKPKATNFSDKHIVFPIPLQELNVNKNLKQNEGW